ncbi:MAG: sugar transferase [Bifidobacterium sp.]|nr:sugar transferase [Bifidobacterium sp.]MCH4209360.1 sugar transferase [Bifidobacterium sp.]
MARKREGEGMDLGTTYAHSTVPEETTRMRVSGPSTMTGAAAEAQAQSQNNPPEPPQAACTNQDDAPPTFFDGSYFVAGSHGRPARAKEGRRWRPFDYNVPAWSYTYNATLVALDMVMTLISATLVLITFPGSYRYLQTHNVLGDGLVEYLILVCATWVVSLALSHIYERHTMGEGYALYSKIMRAIFVDFIILATVSYFFKMDVPRSLTFFVPVLSGIFTIIERWLMRRALHRNRNKGEYNYPTILVGSPQGIHERVRLLREHRGLGYAPIAVCPVASASNTADADGPQHLISVPFEPADEFEAGLRVLPMNSHLPQTAHFLKAQTVLVTDVIERYSETMRTLSLAVESMGIELAFSAVVADMDGASLHLRTDPVTPVFTARLPQYSIFIRICKRIFDIICSSIAIILTSPIMAYVAIRVRSQDGGPAIYKQERIGLYGKPFTLYKFRSMTVNADKQDEALAEQLGSEHGVLFKAKNDPRVTEFGKFIRKTSLDEFPQFFNVFKGDMSMVGPRPQQQYEVDQYESLYSTRLLVKPGITGPWQISGRSNLSQSEAEQLDVSYIQSWSLTGDLAILFKTVSAVVRGTGSY